MGQTQALDASQVSCLRDKQNRAQQSSTVKAGKNAVKPPPSNFGNDLGTHDAKHEAEHAGEAPHGSNSSAALVREENIVDNQWAQALKTSSAQTDQTARCQVMVKRCGILSPDTGARKNRHHDD